jgi:hypothetical protein
MPESELGKRADADPPRVWTLPTAGLLEISPGVFMSNMTVEDTWRRRREVASRVVTKDDLDTSDR